MLRRLRIRFVCINMTIVTVMLIIIMGTIVQLTRSNLEQTSIQMMHTVALLPQQPMPPGEHEAPMQLRYFTLHPDRHGRWVADGDLDYFDLSDQAFLNQLAQDTVSAEEPTGSLKPYKLRYQRVFTPMGPYLVFADMSGEMTTVNSLLRSCILIGLGAFLCFLVISLFLARWAVKPVEQAWDQQHQFVADASHELKTPLTIIMTNAELLQSPQCLPQQRTQFAANILTASEKMRGLVESLLELTRIDNGAVNASFTVLDLSDLIYTAALPFEALYFERDLTLDCQIKRGLMVRGNAGKLSDVIGILLDNAQKYAFAQTQVSLSLQPHGRGQCLLRISNAGDPISPADLENIFKRFYRVDKARSNTHSYGLGLAIADGIVQAHHGRIWAESADGVNTFCIQLPLVQGT